MAAMRAVGIGHRLPAHANVREDGREYVIELDVSDFLESELVIDVVGPRVTVRGNQVEEENDDSVAFRLHEQLEESFRLPDDADPDQVRCVLRARDARVARSATRHRASSRPDRAQVALRRQPRRTGLLKGGEMAVSTTTTNGHKEVGKPRLKRSMGLWMATALVVGNMVGSGIFTLPAVLAGEAGPASVLALVFTGIGAMLLALVFANLGRAHPRTGGPYYFARRAFGDFVGFQTAWAYWIAAWVGNAAIAVAFAGYLGVFWGDVNTTNWLAAVVAIGAVWLFTLVNILGARETGVAQVVTTVLKFVPLAVIGVIGLFYIKGGNYTPFTPAEGGFDWHINAAATLALWAFIGLESATVPAEEVKDPEKTIPRATILGTLATTLLYLVALVAIVGVLSQAALAGSSAPFADAANAIWGGTFLGLSWGKWIALVAMAATLGALNGWIMLTARVSMAAADDGLFPKPFARVHGERRTPVFGLSSRPCSSAGWCSTTGTPASRTASRTSSCWRPG